MQNRQKLQRQQALLLLWHWSVFQLIFVQQAACLVWQTQQL
jgi:hypothetical protein